MKTLLFIADPNSIHDLKWIGYFSANSSNYNCLVLCRKHHFERIQRSPEKLRALEVKNVQLVGFLEEFSIRKSRVSLIQLFKIRKVVRQHKVDLIHIMYAEPNALWAIGKSIIKKPIVLTTRGTDVLIDIPKFIESSEFGKRLLAQLYFWAFKNLDAITSTSELQKQKIEGIFHLKIKPQLIRTGIPIQDMNKDTSEFLPRALRGKKIVFFPRIMKPLYNHEFCLDAIKNLPPAITANYSFVFINSDSEDTEYVNKINSIIDTLSHCQIIFLKSLSQNSIFEVMKHSSLVVMTPLSDGTPNSALEAMALGIPVILPPLPYDNSIFENTVTQLTSWNVDELTNAINRTIHYPNFEQIKDAKETVVKNLDQQLEMDKMDKIYKSILC